MLRLDAERFGTAEYYEATRDGERPRDPPPAGLVRARRRRSPSRSCYIHPDAAARAVPRARATGSAPSSAASPTGSVGDRVAVAFATFRYHRIRFPGAWSYPGALLNSIAHRVHRRGRVPRRALRPAPRRPASNPTLANVIQAILYALTTRLGAPGRDRYMLVLTLGHRPRRRLADGRDRRHRGGVPGPRDHPLRDLPVHRPRRPDQAARPRGRGDREAPPAARGLAGHRRRASAAAPGAMTVRPSAAPPVALYVHVPFCVSLCPYCDFVVFAGAAARGPRARVDAVRRGARGRARPARRRARRGVRRPDAAAALETLYLGGGTPSLLPPDGGRAGSSTRVRERFGLADGRRGHPRGQPGPDERGDPAACGAPASPGSRSARSRCRRRASSGGSAGATAPRTSADAVAEARGGRHRRRSASTCSTTCPDQTRRRLDDDARGGARPRADHLSLYALTLDDPDAEGLTGPDGDHLPTTPGARRWRDDRPARPGRGPRRRRSTTTPSSAWPRPASAATRSATGRGPATRAGTTWPTGSAGRTRRSGPGAHAFDGVTRRWNAARLDGYLAALAPADGSAPRPAARRQRSRSMPRRPRPRRSSSACGSTPASRSPPAHEPPLADAFGWALAAELVDVTPDDRVVLTTRGRLLSNELFAASSDGASSRARRRGPISVDTRSSRLLRCRHLVSTLTVRVLTTLGDRPWRDETAAHRPPGPSLTGDPSGRHRGIRHHRHAGRLPGARRALRPRRVERDRPQHPRRARGGRPADPPAHVAPAASRPTRATASTSSRSPTPCRCRRSSS